MEAEMVTTRAITKLPQLIQFDETVLSQHPQVTHLIGVDEVGRGSCIGPVTAAAFCFQPDNMTAYTAQLTDLNDSKQLTVKQREHLYIALTPFGTHAIAEASQEEVERINVYQASLLAAKRSVLALCQALKLLAPEDTTLPETVLVLLDGKATIKEFAQQRQKAIIKGDGQSFCIAAASVVAKHHRDKLMVTLAQDFPGYQWETNMGYPTPAHKQAISQLGPTVHHRKTYKTVSQLSLPLA